jgi:hypothetical protein
MYQEDVGIRKHRSAPQIAALFQDDLLDPIYINERRYHRSALNKLEN